jgi:hypothetical protein
MVKEIESRISNKLVLVREIENIIIDAIVSHSRGKGKLFILNRRKQASLTMPAELRQTTTDRRQ